MTGSAGDWLTNPPGSAGDWLTNPPDDQPSGDPETQGPDARTETQVPGPPGTRRTRADLERTEIPLYADQVDALDALVRRMRRIGRRIGRPGRITRADVVREAVDLLMQRYQDAPEALMAVMEHTDRTR